MNKEFQQMTSWVATGWGAIWSGCLWLGDHPLSWWVSVFTIVALLGNIKSQWFPRKHREAAKK